MHVSQIGAGNFNCDRDGTGKIPRPIPEGTACGCACLCGADLEKIDVFAG